MQSNYALDSSDKPFRHLLHGSRNEHVSEHLTKYHGIMSFHAVVILYDILKRLRFYLSVQYQGCGSSINHYKGLFYLITAKAEVLLSDLYKG
jgi:hypothetical protein